MMIKQYCRESGVRNLKKQLEKVYRKAALALATSPNVTVRFCAAVWLPCCSAIACVAGLMLMCAVHGLQGAGCSLDTRAPCLLCCGLYRRLVIVMLCPGAGSCMLLSELCISTRSRTACGCVQWVEEPIGDEGGDKTSHDTTVQATQADGATPAASAMHASGAHGAHRWHGILTPASGLAQHARHLHMQSRSSGMPVMQPAVQQWMHSRHLRWQMQDAEKSGTEDVTDGDAPGSEESQEQSQERVKVRSGCTFPLALTGNGAHANATHFTLQCMPTIEPIRRRHRSFARTLCALC